MGRDGEVRLGRDGVRTGWAYVVIAAAAGAGVLWWAIASSVTSGVLHVALSLFGTSGSLIWLLTRLGDGGIVLGRDTIAVRTGEQEHTWPWSEILELGTARSGRLSAFTVPGCSVMVRPDGSTWDTPGPNAPLMVPLPVFGPRANRRVTDALRRACDQHGVPFTSKALRDAQQPRPGSRFRSDRTP